MALMSPQMNLPSYPQSSQFYYIYCCSTAFCILVGLKLPKIRLFLLTSVTLRKMMKRKAHNASGNLSNCVSSRCFSFPSLTSHAVLFWFQITVTDGSYTTEHGATQTQSCMIRFFLPLLSAMV